MAVQQTQVLPAPFIEAAGKTFLADLQSAIGGLRGADLSKVMGPQFVAPTSAITQEAQALRGGLGTFRPFLQTAAADARQATQFTGPQSYQQFLSPFQQDVIKTTLDEFDVQAAKGLPLRENSKGVKEIDLRKTGGFIPPVGVKEKADDIPAMLSNNEFVFTADAVRAAGGGSVNKGAQRMSDLMKNLESKVV